MKKYLYKGYISKKHSFENHCLSYLTFYPHLTKQNHLPHNLFLSPTPSPPPMCRCVGCWPRRRTPSGGSTGCSWAAPWRASTGPPPPTTTSQTTSWPSVTLLMLMLILRFSRNTANRPSPVHRIVRSGPSDEAPPITARRNRAHVASSVHIHAFARFLQHCQRSVNHWSAFYEENIYFVSYLF